MEPNDQNQYPVNQGNIIPEIQNEENFDGKMPPSGNKKIKLLAIIFAALIVLAVIPLSFFLYTKGQKSSLLAESQTKALEAYKKGDIVGLQKELLNSYKIAPKDPKTQAALIKAIATEGNLTGKEQDAFNKAAPYVADALATNGNNAEVLVAVGYVNEIAGKYNEALSFYEKALNIDDKNAEGWFHKGHVLEFLGKQSDAFSAYTKAYELNPKDPTIVTSYAKVIFSQGKTTDAFNLYKEAANLPDISAIDKADALTNASILRRVSLLTAPEAIELSKQAVEIAPNYSPALAVHGFNIGIYDRDLPNGIIYLKRSIEANPRITQNYGRLAALYRLSGNFPEAVVQDEKALQAIDNDNTLFTQQEKDTMKGGLLYDLALSNYKVDPNSDVLGLLINSMQLAPGLKPILKRDYEQFGYYKNLETNPAFQTLIQ